MPIPDDSTGGLDVSQLMQNAGMQDLMTANTDGSSSSSAGGSNPYDINALITIGNNMAASVAAAQVAQKGALSAQEALTKLQQANLEQGAQVQQQAGQAAANIAGKVTAATYDTQQKNQIAAGNVNDALSSAVDDISIATARHGALLRAAQQASENSNFANVLFGDTTFRQFLSANFTDTPETYLGRANVEANIVKDKATQVIDLQNIYTGAAERNQSSQANLDAGSQADAATVAASQYARVSTELQQQSFIAGSGYLKEVMSANQDASQAIGQAQVGTFIENAKRADQRASAAFDGKDPESFAAIVRLGGKFLGNDGLSSLQGQTLKQFENNPAAKALINRAYMIGQSLAGSAAINGTNAPLPQLFESPADALDAFKGSRGKMPQGMGRVQTFLNEQEAGTDFFVNNGVQGKAMKPAEKAAEINTRVDSWYSKHMNNIDATDLYGKPPIKVIASMASMNSTPASALFTKTVLQPLAMSSDSVPIAMLGDASFTAVKNGKLPLNTAVEGLVNYAKSAQAQADATAKYNVVGLKPARTLPYTGIANTSGVLWGGKTTINWADKKQVNDYLFKRLSFEENMQNVTPGLGAF